MAAGGSDRGEVGLPGAGVVGQVGRVTELGGVDEDGHGHHVALLGGPTDQRAVSVVRARPWWDHADGHARLPDGVQGGGVGGDGVEDLDAAGPDGSVGGRRRGPSSEWAGRGWWSCHLLRGVSRRRLPRPPLPRRTPAPPTGRRRRRDRLVGHRRVQGQAPGQADHGVVGGQLGAMAGHGRQGAPVAVDGLPVAPRRRAGQRLARARGTKASSVAARIRPAKASRGSPADGRHPLDLPDEGDEVVGGDRGGRVVRGAAARRRRSIARPPRASARPDGHGVAGHGEGDARRQPTGADPGIGQRHQRVERSAPRMRGQDVQAQ